MMTTTAITVLGIFAASATIIIVSLVGFIGKGIRDQINDLSSETKERQTLIFKEIDKRQTKEICKLKTIQIRKDVENLAK